MYAFNLYRLTFDIELYNQLYFQKMKKCIFRSNYRYYAEWSKKESQTKLRGVGIDKDWIVCYMGARIIKDWMTEWMIDWTIKKKSSFELYSIPTCSYKALNETMMNGGYTCLEWARWEYVDVRYAVWSHLVACCCWWRYNAYCHFHLLP